MTSLPEYLTLDEASAALGISKHRMRHLLLKKVIHPAARTSLGNPLFIWSDVRRVGVNIGKLEREEMLEVQGVIRKEEMSGMADVTPART